eukprot:TRINITY_DN9828_c0_g1_i2.p1 TRINITY_DN9828_c0_g1~~TRINITY_DN9828_c0_g1_i2.p1  ORF type:complete len:121 (-),score=14.02 TRINITY_DN9828_c0_g1_i2:119-481(-)
MEHESGLTSKVDKLYNLISRRWQKLLDDSISLFYVRWLILLLFLSLALYNVLMTDSGWHVIVYALGFYVFEMFKEFLNPLRDPSDVVELPTRGDEEYKPFVRKSSEFTLWFVEFFFSRGN